jgi:hypothetical protein
MYKTLRHVKISLVSTNKNTSGKAKLSFLSPIPPASYQMTLLLEMPELWWKNQVDLFFYVKITIAPWFSMLTYQLGNEQ